MSISIFFGLSRLILCRVNGLSRGLRSGLSLCSFFFTEKNVIIFCFTLDRNVRSLGSGYVHACTCRPINYKTRNNNCGFAFLRQIFFSFLSEAQFKNAVVNPPPPKKKI
jgi:hypothetical protein